MLALVELLQGDEPALSVMAAWALGRIGDRSALDALRAGLNARYRSVQVHCARSLGSLADRESGPLFLARLTEETDPGLQLAYASALGKLQVDEAVERLLWLLYNAEDSMSRVELALALARIVGDEHRFIRLGRSVRAEIGTATSQALTAAKKRFADHPMVSDELLALTDRCADTLAREQLAAGVELLREIIGLLPQESYSRTAGTILRHCADRLEEFGAERSEYVLLALHTLNVG